MKRYLIPLMISIALLSTSPAVAAKTPPGSVTLPKTSLQRIGAVQCGLLKKSWEPGTLYNKKQFVSHMQQYKNFHIAGMKSKGKQQVALLRLRDQWLSKRGRQFSTCRQIGQSTTTPTTPGQSTPTTTTTTTPATATGLRFNIKNAVGLTLRSTVSSSSVRKFSTGSNLQAVSATGTTVDAVSSGTASISKFLIAPNDKLYVVFNQKTLIDQTLCLLAEVSKSTGIPVCIDSELSSINWPSTDTSWSYNPIQFDSEGAIYYAGTDSSGKVTLKKYKDGTSSSLITDNIDSLVFQVISDGRVIIGGTTRATSASWTRLLNQSGGLQTLVAGTSPRFIARFPDNNIYMGFWGPTDVMGVKRFLVATSVMDSVYWISGNTNGVSRPSFFDVGATYYTPDRIPALDPSYGTNPRKLLTTSDGKVYVIFTSVPQSLVQYFPNVLKTSTAVTAVAVAQNVLTYVIMSGTDASGKNLTTLYNTANDTELILIPASNEVEIYHLNFTTTSNSIMFDGLRFSDNKYVIGRIDLTTMQMTSTPTGSSKLIDFQTFGS